VQPPGESIRADLLPFSYALSSSGPDMVHLNRPWQSSAAFRCPSCWRRKGPARSVLRSGSVLLKWDRRIPQVAYFALGFRFTRVIGAAPSFPLQAEGHRNPPIEGTTAVSASHAAHRVTLSVAEPFQRRFAAISFGTHAGALFRPRGCCRLCTDAGPDLRPRAFGSDLIAAFQQELPPTWQDVAELMVSRSRQPRGGLGRLICRP
jgi:hypothetical protein